MTKRARPPSPLPSLVSVAALLSVSAVTGSVAAQDAGAATLDAKPPTIILRIAGGAAPGTRLTIDDKPAPLDESLPIDPGRHTIMVATPDGRLHSEPILVREGERERDVVLAVPPPHPPEVLGGVPPRVERGGGCCGSTRAATAAHDLRATSGALLLAAVLAARRKKRNEG